jgi:hypothetical protein
VFTERDDAIAFDDVAAAVVAAAADGGNIFSSVLDLDFLAKEVGMGETELMDEMDEIDGEDGRTKAWQAD